MPVNKQSWWTKRLARWWADRVRPYGIPIGVFFAGILFIGLLSFRMLPAEIATAVVGLFGVVIGTGITAWSQDRIQKQQMVAETRRTRRERIERLVGLFRDMLEIERALRREQKELYSNTDRTRQMIQTVCQNAKEIEFTLLIHFPKLYEGWAIDECVTEDGKEFRHQWHMFECEWHRIRYRLEDIVQGKGEPTFNEDDFNLWRIWPDLLEEARKQVS